MEVNAAVKHKSYLDVDERGGRSMTALLTIFSAPKPFNNAHISLIQRNAIHSWKDAG